MQRLLACSLLFALTACGRIPAPPLDPADERSVGDNDDENQDGDAADNGDDDGNGGDDDVDPRRPDPDDGNTAGPDDGCGNETAFGRCDGNTLVFCAEGGIERLACDEACGFINDDYGYDCVSGALPMLEQEQGSFVCEQNGQQFGLGLFRHQAMVSFVDGSDHPGEYSLTNDGNLHVVVPGVLDATFDALAFGAEMIGSMSGSGVSCEAFSYAVDDGFNFFAACTASSWEPGMYMTHYEFTFHEDGSLSARRITFMDQLSDEWTSTFSGAYWVDGAQVGLVWLEEDGAVESETGIINADGYLEIPRYEIPLCDW